MKEGIDFHYVLNIRTLVKFHKWLKNSVKSVKKKKLLDLRNREYTLNKFEELFILLINKEKKWE